MLRTDSVGWPLPSTTGKAASAYDATILAPSTLLEAQECLDSSAWSAGEAAQLEHVLQTWDAVWMGSGCTDIKTPNSASSPLSPRNDIPSAASPVEPHLAHPVLLFPQAHHDSTQSNVNQTGRPVPTVYYQVHPDGDAAFQGYPISAIPSAIAMAAGAPQAPHDKMMPMLPMTPPLHHAPLAIASGAKASSIAPAHGVPFVQDAVPAHEEPTHQSSTAVGMAQHPNYQEFAHVFFSPLPRSLLAITKSESQDSLVSPDATHRNGRVPLPSRTPNLDWSEGGINVALVSPLLSTDIDLLTATGAANMQQCGILNDAADSSTGALEGPLKSRRSNQSSAGPGAIAHARSNDTDSTALSAPQAEPLASKPSNDHTLLTCPSTDTSAATEADEDTEQGATPMAVDEADNRTLSTSAPIPVHASGSVPIRVTSHAHHSSDGDGEGDASMGGFMPNIPHTPVAYASLFEKQEPQAVQQPVSLLQHMCPQFLPHAISSPPASAPGQPLALGHLDMLQKGQFSSIAAAAADLRKNPDWAALKLVAGCAMIPHVDKVAKGGEDAYCICQHLGLGALGVADGVSGWADEGIDPAEYSRSLMKHAAQALENVGPNGVEAREVIRFAHQATCMAGSSTVCLALMKPNARLEVANLGDSGVRVVRDGRIVFASAAQQHMFNMPFQLSHPSIIDSPDDANSADVTMVDVQPDDIIVLATDGLYDNVFDEEIARICGEATQRRRLEAQRRGADPAPYTATDAQELAGTMARLAHRYAQDPYQRTPWSVSACEQGFAWARYFAKGGGKMDDVTLVVAFVTA